MYSPYMGPGKGSLSTSLAYFLHKLHSASDINLVCLCKKKIMTILSTLCEPLVPFRSLSVSIAAR